ncbi:MAG: ribonuclease HII [Clostridia bacterium]|nr:ribonuclease HII [Clostridia bacterium]
MTQELFDFDKKIADSGYKYICGVDEAGRGPLCGPVSVGAVIMPMDRMIEGITDSKKISEKKREKLYDEVINTALFYKCVMIDNEVIDEINILEATKRAMREAVLGLGVDPDIVLIDAVKLALPFETRSIIKGDATSYAIASASIIAKVERDRLMAEYDKEYPEYGFLKNKGYGTKAHIDALKKYGPTKVHRKTFIRNFIGE